MSSDRRAKPPKKGRVAPPDEVAPMLATSGEFPAREGEYAFEVKWDGYRVVARVAGGRVTLRSRNLNEVTQRFPEIQELAKLLRGHDVVLDGEAVAFDEKGNPSFQRLQAGEGPVAYMVFDLLFLDGVDTTTLPYEARRELLEALPLDGDHVQLTPSFREGGRTLLAQPRLEGIIAKKLGSTYEAGRRSKAWLKIKSQKRQELVIGGFTKGEGARDGTLGALLMGYYEGPRFVYAGKVGTGFTDAALKDLHKRLVPLIVETSPFADKIPERGPTFVKPKLVGEVEFTEWTDDGRLRHPSFKGLRDDKDAKDVVKEDA